MSKFYCETNCFNRKVCREIVEGTEEMLSTFPEKNALVEIRNLDITYGYGPKKFYAIKNLNLNIYEGEVLGLVGESGSGKSTTGRAIIGLTPHSFGYIKILDRIIPKNLDKSFKFSKKYKDIINFMVNNVQMIFQDPTNSLNPYQNVEKVVGEGLTNTKNSKYILISAFDEEVFKNIYFEVEKLDKKNKLFDNSWINTFNNYRDTLEKSFDLVYVQTKNIIENRIKDNNEYQNLLNWLNRSEKEREELLKLTEKEAKKELIINILKQVGLDETVLNRFPLEFSGGQQQRIGICRSVILKPRLLIADEPISALDVSIQAQVINIFNELKKKYNLTILFIAHDLRMVEYISDRIAVINKGILLEIGPTEEIIYNAKHPYTKSLLAAVPSIEGTKGSLIKEVYDPNIHNYSLENQPIWNNLGNQHFVLATKEEIETYKK